MATLLADPAAPAGQQAGHGAGAAPPQPLARSCPNCAAPLDAAQDWCLHCGAGAPGSLLAAGAHWRPAAAVLSAVALLVVGAGAAAYAALSKSTRHPRPATSALAILPTSVPGAGATLPPTAAATPAPTVPKLGARATPLPALQKPKVATGGTKAPATSATTTPASTTTTPASTTPAAGGTTSTGTSTTPPAETKPAALLLDTNATSTYNPDSYPSSDFGDPSLAIDGESSTGWTALVEPSLAPRMAAGLVVDLKSRQRLSALSLISSTPGMTVQVYGSAAASVPPAITDPAWARLTEAFVAKRHDTRVALGDSKQAFRFVVLWISKAPSGAGHVSVNELELFPAS
jgi:hypothetical protein